MMKKSLFAVVALFLGVLASAPVCAEDSSTLEAPSSVNLSDEPPPPEQIINTQDNQRFAIKLKGKNTRVFVRVNDIPVLFKILREDQEFDIAFNEWIKQGLNIVNVSAEPFDDHAASKLNYRIYYQSPSQIVSKESLTLFESPPEVNLPIRQSAGFRAKTVPDLRVWEAESVRFTPNEQSRLLDMLNGFRSRIIEAVGKADNAYLATYDKMLRDEVNVAYGRRPESKDDIIARRREIAMAFRKDVNAGLVASPVLQSSELDFEAVGNGKLVRISRLDGQPLIEVKRGTLTFSVDKPIYGRIGGVWEMLRE